MKHYSINPDTKVITAKIARLTNKELAEVQKYVALGFKVEDGEPTPNVVKRLDEDYIIKYLDDNLNAEEAKEAKAKYEEMCNSTVFDDSGKPKTRKDKTTEKTEIITQGFNAGRNWFAKTYPIDIAELPLNGKAKDTIADAYKTYKSKGDKANKKLKDAGKEPVVYLNETEYTRYYYWTKIFQQV